MTKAIFISSIAVILAASGGYWVGKNHHAADYTAPSAAFIEPNNLTPPTVTPSPNANIEKNFQQGNRLIDKANPASAPEEPAAVDQSAQHQINTLKTEYEFTQRSESFTHWLIKNQETKPWFDLGIEMFERFDAEEIDHYWAGDKEGHLRSVFTQEQALAGIAVKSTVCKSTQCQITISVIDHDHATETTNAIITALSAENFSQIIVDSQVQQGETIFYVSSNEKGFEFN